MGRAEKMGLARQIAPAKINLWLEIVGRRSDGFHLLDSLVGFADFGEALSGTPAKDWSLKIVGTEAASLIAEGQGTGQAPNLVLRAAEAFHKAYGGETFAFTLEKHLPTASGIGGGSADAAACLRLLADARRVDTRTEQFGKLCLELGADVPMCLASTSALIGGIGEDISPVTGLAGLFIVAVNPRQPISTPEVFASYAKLCEWENSSKVRPLPSASPPPKTSEAWLEVIAKRTNDLQPAASLLCPDISQIAGQVAAQNGCQIARMSGSGATVFGLFLARQEADQARANLQAEWPDWWVKSAELM